MFRGATRSDLPEILKIYARAREAMAAAGNPAQWGTSFPPEELLKEDIDSNRLFVYLVNGELEAVFAFILGPDPTYRTITDGQWILKVTGFDKANGVLKFANWWGKSIIKDWTAPADSAAAAGDDVTGIAAEEQHSETERLGDEGAERRN